MQWSSEMLKQVELTIGDALGQQLSTSAQARSGQKFDADLLAFLAEKLLIPMLVTFFGNVLLDQYRRITGAASSPVQKDQIAKALNAQGPDTDRDPTPEAMQELRQQLAPLGLSDSQILAVREVVWSKLKSLETS